MKYLINKYLGNYLEINDFNFDWMMNTGFMNLKIRPSSFNNLLADKNIRISEGIIGEIKIDYSISKKYVNIILKNVKISIYRNYQNMGLFECENTNFNKIKRRKESFTGDFKFDEEVDELNNNFKKSFINVEERDSFILNLMKEMEFNIKIENLEFIFNTGSPLRELPNFIINFDKIKLKKLFNNNNFFNIDIKSNNFYVKLDNKLIFKNKNKNFFNSLITFNYKNKKLENLEINFDIDNIALFINNHNLIYIIEVLIYFDNVFLIKKVIDILRSDINNFNFNHFDEYINKINKKKQNNENDENLENDIEEDNTKNDSIINDLKFNLNFKGLHILLVDLNFSDYANCSWIKEKNNPLIFEIPNKNCYYQINLNDIKFSSDKKILIKNFEFFTLKSEVNKIDNSKLLLKNSFSKIDINSEIFDNTFNGFQSVMNDISFEHKYIINISKKDDYSIIINLKNNKIDIIIEEINLDLDLFYIQYHIEYLFQNNQNLKEKLKNIFEDYNKKFNEFGSENFLEIEKLYLFNHLSQQNFDEILLTLSNINKENIFSQIIFKFPKLDLLIKKFNIIFNIQNYGVNKLVELNFDLNCNLNQNQANWNIKNITLDILDKEININLESIDISYNNNFLNVKFNNFESTIMLSTLEKFLNFSNVKELLNIKKIINFEYFSLFLEIINNIQKLNFYNNKSYEIFKKLENLFYNFIYKGINLDNIKFEINNTKFELKVDGNDERFKKENNEEFNDWDDWNIVKNNGEIINLKDYNNKNNEIFTLFKISLDLIYLELNSEFKIVKLKLNNNQIKVLNNLIKLNIEKIKYKDLFFIYNINLKLNLIDLIEEFNKIVNFVNILFKNKSKSNNNNNEDEKFNNFINKIEINNINCFIEYFVYSFNLKLEKLLINFDKNMIKLIINYLTVMYILNYDNLLKNKKLVEIFNLNFDKNNLRIDEFNIDLNDNIIKLILEIKEYIFKKIDFGLLNNEFKNENDNKNIKEAKIKINEKNDNEDVFDFGLEYDDLLDLEYFLNELFKKNTNIKELIYLLPFEYNNYIINDIKIENIKFNIDFIKENVNFEFLLNKFNYIYINQISETFIIFVNKFLIIDKKLKNNYEYLLSHENEFLMFIMNKIDNKILSLIIDLSKKIDLFLHEKHLNCFKNLIKSFKKGNNNNKDNKNKKEEKIEIKKDDNNEYIIDILKISKININLKTDTKNWINIINLIPNINIYFDEFLLLNFEGNLLLKIKKEYYLNFLKNFKKIIKENKLNLPLITLVINIFKFFFSLLKSNDKNINNNLKSILKSCIIDLKRTKSLSEKLGNELLNLFSLSKNYFKLMLKKN